MRNWEPNPAIGLILLVGMTVFLAVLIGTFVLDLGAEPSFEHAADELTPTTLDDRDVQRFVDEEAGVVCYQKQSSHSISCLPLNQTRLTTGGGRP